MSTPPSSLPPITMTSTPTPAFLESFIHTIALAFHTPTPSALSDCFISEIDGLHETPPYPPQHPPPTTLTRRIAHVRPGITSSVSNTTEPSHNAILIATPDFSAVASWEPPSYTGPPFSAVQRARPQGPVLSEWREAVARMRATYIGLAAPSPSPDTAAQPAPLLPHYHLSFLCRNPTTEPAVAGAVRAVTAPMLARARDEGVPVWLEATTRHGVAVYEHYGFRVCEEVTVGVGRIGEEGWPEEGGVGVKAWGMIWDAHLRESR